MKIAQCDLYAGVEPIREEILKAIQEVVDSGWYIIGEKCTSFESAFSAYNSVDHCVGVANGTDAIELTLRALGIGMGDMVATVSHTAVATVAAIDRAGATPVFVDVDENTYTMCPESLSEVLRKYPGIKAVVVVHLYGHPADLDSILSLLDPLGIPLIEDCAQAHGATLRGKKVGSIGRAGAFSFYPTKNLGALGDGGAVITRDASLAQSIRELRQYGWRERYVSDKRGVNSRLDELQAAVLLCRLPQLEADNRKRRDYAAIYSAGLTGMHDIRCPVVLPMREHAFHQYVIQCDARHALQQRLLAIGIGTAIHYPVPVHQQPAFASCPRTDLHRTDQLSGSILSLPMYAQMSHQVPTYVVKAIEECL